jgi:hypothetical protein
MAKVHGKDSFFELNSVELSAFLTEISVSRSGDVAEASTMGDSAKEYMPGLKDATISISGRWDDTASTGPDAVLSAALGTEVAFEYGPEGDDSGDIKHSGNCIVTAYNVSSSIGDVVAFTAEMQVTGAVTVGTFTP